MSSIHRHVDLNLNNLPKISEDIRFNKLDDIQRVIQINFSFSAHLKCV